MILAWTFWFACQLIMLIILLNFIIAVISDTYARVSEDREIHRYRHKALLNAEAYGTFDWVTKGEWFQALVITSEKKLV